MLLETDGFGIIPPLNVAVFVALSGAGGGMVMAI
jgi:hypothetical protein